MKKYFPPLYLLVFSLSLSIFPQQNDFERWGIDLILRENEISPSIVVDYPMGMYRLVGPKIHTTLIIKDPNNNAKLSVSWSGAITLFGYLTGALLNLDDFDRESRKALRLAIIIPCLLINSEHHIFFISPQSTLEGSPIAASVFANSRLDIFNDKWWRYSIGSGLQFELNLGNEEYVYENKAIGIQFGAEVPVFDNGIYDKGLRLFGGIRWVFPN